MTAKIPAFTDIGKTARGEDLLPAGSMRQQIRLVPKKGGMPEVRRLNVEFGDLQTFSSAAKTASSNTTNY